MIINEIFESIQGEGKYSGTPVLFIRTSGCTRNCSFCDTKYHKNGKKMTVKQLINKINKSNCDTIVWTGGEPMLQEQEIYDIILATPNKYHQLETNGDVLPQSPECFQYIAFSPKEKRTSINVYSFCMQLNDELTKWDIKIVTDLKLNKNMIEEATMLMPLTMYDTKMDKKIQQDVWTYCVKHNIKYCQRIHVDVWGSKIGK